MNTGPAVQVPWLGVTVPAVKPLGKVSVSVTAVASDGPALVTVMTYVPLDTPAVTIVTPSVLVTARSATRVDGGLARCRCCSPGFGSVVDEATVAVLDEDRPGRRGGVDRAGDDDHGGTARSEACRG